MASEAAGRGLIVHEWIERYGGAEKVLASLVDALPGSRLLVLWNDDDGALAEDRVEETWLARTPLRRFKPVALLFMPWVWRTVRVGVDVRWVVVSSHLFAHHVKVKGVPKLVYAHTPARYIWVPELDGRGTSWPARIAAIALRRVDRRRAQEATDIAVNSEYVRDRVAAAWGRDARVIYPPVAVSRLQVGAPWASKLDTGERDLLDQLPEDFVLGVSRFVPYKRLDRVIEAGESQGMPVVLVGGGPEERSLRDRADAASIPVHFVLAPSDALLYAIYERASVLVFPPVEDFGIVPVEAMALGLPVIASSEGGAGESVRYCSGGALVDVDSPAAWGGAFDAVSRVDRDQMRHSALFFDEARFERAIREWVNRCTSGSPDVAPGA